MKTLKSTLFPAYSSGKAAFLSVLVVAVALLSETPLVANGAEPGGSPPAVIPKKDVADMDLMELARVRVISATLTSTQVRRIPAQTTELDAATIEQSGARHLDELLEIYAPNVQVALHSTHMEHFGIRGIISDRDDKYLLRVNGKVMNNLMFVGAETERGLPLLGDLRSVTLVHGPASATYGVGALAGVMNLETYNGLTFEGADAQIRQGFWHKFTAVEARFGHKFDEDSGLFLYAGVATQKGADQDDSPQVFGASFETPGATPDVVSGQALNFPVPNLHDGGNFLKMKFHASYVTGPVEAWARYTQNGDVSRHERPVLRRADVSEAQKGRKSLHQQFTTGVKHKVDLSDTFNLETFASYDYYRYLIWVYDYFSDEQNRHEHEAYGRVLGTWTPTENQSLALGLEYSHLWFGGTIVGLGPGANNNESWQVDVVSVLAEHQWRLAEEWTTFASFRTDKHSYTDWLLSPRLALVYTPTQKDTVKLIAARSVRRNGDGELRKEHNPSRFLGTNAASGSVGSDETLDSLELRYDRQHTEQWGFGVGVFGEQNKAIGWDPVAVRSVKLGTFDIFGLDAEITFRAKKTKLNLSHSYTQLIDASLAKTNTITGITSEPYGYGHDLANWANHSTKLAVIQDLHAQWSASTSLRVFWGFPGTEDQAEWNGAGAMPVSDQFSLHNRGYDKAYGPSVYWNAGLEYRPTQRLTLRADAFNILGWVDQTLNKRMYILSGSDYSVEAAAVALSAKLAF